MALSTTEIIGFTNQFIKLLEDNREDLQAKGLDVSAWITECREINEQSVASDAATDDLRAALKAKTAETQNLVKENYKTTSTRLDAVIGVLGKSTPLAKQISRLRSSLNRPATRRTAEKAK